MSTPATDEQVAKLDDATKWNTTIRVEPFLARALIARIRADKDELASKNEQIGKLYRVCNEKDVLKNECARLRAELAKRDEKIARVTAAEETTYRMWERMKAQRNEAHGEIDRLKAELASRDDALRECADDLEALIEHQYKSAKEYPDQRRKYERDMAPVRRARTVLGADRR